MNTDKIFAQAIANEYSKKENSKVVALKKLDKKAKLPSLVFAYTFGILSSLLLGVGMCLCMGKLGNGETGFFITGIFLGVLGMIGCAVNYPIFCKLRQRGKEKYANDVITLANEIAE